MSFYRLSLSPSLSILYSLFLLAAFELLLLDASFFSCSPVQEPRAMTSGEVIHWVDFDFTFTLNLDVDLPAIHHSPQLEFLLPYSTSQSAPTLPYLHFLLSVVAARKTPLLLSLTLHLTALLASATKLGCKAAKVPSRHSPFHYNQHRPLP